MQKNSDIKIIKRIRNGEVIAYSELIDRHQNFAFTVANNILKNREEAEEVIQDAFLKAFKHLNDFKGDSAFSTWLYRIVYNTAVSKKRLKKVSQTPIDDYNIQNEISHTVESINTLEKNDRKRYLKKAISKLNDDDRMVVLLYYYKELSINEISEITSLSESNIKVKLHRSRQQLFSVLSTMLKGEFTNTF